MAIRNFANNSVNIDSCLETLLMALNQTSVPQIHDPGEFIVNLPEVRFIFGNILWWLYMSLNKYCSFLPIEIEFGTKTEYIEDESADVELSE